MYNSRVNVLRAQLRSLFYKTGMNFPFLLSFLLLTVILISACETKTSIATVGTEEIFQEEFIERYENYLIQTGIKDNILTRKEVLNSMITEVLLEKCDDNSEIEKNPEYQKELEWTKNQAILGFLKDREVYRNIKVTEEELRNSFLRSNQKIAARHLFAKTEEEIAEISQLLSIGVDFNTLAKQTFTDSTLRNNGGYIGYFTWGEMDPEFENKAFSMKIGEISSPVKTEHGYSIIKLEDKVSHPLLTENEFINQKEKLAQIIRVRKKKPSVRNFVNNQIRLDAISFNKKQISSLWKNFQTTVKDIDNLIENVDGDSIIVSYETNSYTTLNIVNRINNIPNYHLEKITSRENLEAVIKGLILQDRLLAIAEDKGYADSKYVVKKLAEMNTNLLVRYKISEIIEKSVLHDTLVYKFYEENTEFFSSHDEIKLQEIWVQQTDLAKKIIKSLKSGADFGRLAKQYSVRINSSQNGGVVGFVPVKKLGPLKTHFEGLAVNNVIGPIELNDYLGIFKILDRRDSKIFEFDEVKDVATLAVKYKLKNEILREYVDKIKIENNVNIDLAALGATKIFQFD